ncbi:kinesin [Novymonas esmeraldas]|uniref:Kinesin n=1 Tax=Novymonas esmeraldas TaxID=1808958 RepID=A0AAW0ELK5_9TRYP
MHAYRSSSNHAARRQSDRGVASSSLLSQHDGSPTDGSVYATSVPSELRQQPQRRGLGGAMHTRAPSAATSAPSPPSPDYSDEAHLYTGVADTRDNFKVAVRVRPPLQRELHGYSPFVDVVLTSPEHANTITLCDALDTEDGRGAVYSRQSYTFDHVHTAAATQEDVYERSARPAVLSVLDGFNATLMAYGQTGTGKTYTMEGFTGEEERGIIPRAVEDVFAAIDERRRRRTGEPVKFLVRASYLQIYNEVLSDLLEPPPSNALSGGGGSGSGSRGGGGGGGGGLVVRHTPQRGVHVDGLSEWIVRTPEDVYGLIAKGTALRATSATKLSELSSRSHAIFTVVVEAMEGDEASPTSYRCGKLNIVDLAGSEKIRLAGVTGQRLEETKNINKSLHELGNVIAALAAKSGAHGRRVQRHVPFRNSALTSALRDSLGGNCKTTLIACISPALESYAESLSTLMFANRAKNIQNHAVVNEGVSQATLLRTYEQELRRLRQQLHERTEMSRAGGSGLADSADTHVLLSELEEDRRRAEEDRQVALAALQKSSVAHQEEMRVRQELEGRIRELEAVLREGGVAGSPRTSREYAERLLELDRERQAVAEDKEQVERYKQLLLKQRDIMLSLTTRLNDRDETILLLQEEVDAYDQHVQGLEEEVERLTRLGEAERRAPSPSLASTAVAVVNPQLVGNASEAQAYDFIQRRRVPAPAPAPPSSSSMMYGEEGREGGGVRGGASPLYRSLLQPSRAVSAEQLAVELVMLQGRTNEPTNTTTGGAPTVGAARSASVSHSNASGPHDTRHLFSAEELASIMRQRADAIVHTHYDAEVAQLRASVAALTLQLRNSQDKAHAADKEARVLAQRLDGSNGRSDAAVAAVRRELRAELEARQRAYASTMDAVHDAIRTESAARARVAREVDRIRVEVQHLLETSAASLDGERRAAVSRTWQRLQEVEGEVRRQGVLAELPALLATVADGASTGQDDTPARERALLVQVEEQQRRIADLERETARRGPQRGPPETSSTAVRAEGVEEAVAVLRRQLAVHEKDRRALRTILEQRMKGKIDRVCELLAVDGLDGVTKAGSEARSLQGLIHASIKAMDAEV